MASNDTRGGLYLGFGVHYLMMAGYSAYTAKKNGGIASVSITTNLPIEQANYNGLRLFDNVNYVNDYSINNRNYKIDSAEWTPYTKTIYLDCDTLILGTLAPLFYILDNVDFLVKMNNYPSASTRSNNAWGKSLKELNLPEFNSGVFAFAKNQRVKLFFEQWKYNYNNLGVALDQPSLAKTIYESSGLKWLPLPGIWNAKDMAKSEGGMLNEHLDMVKIFHYRNPTTTKLISEEYKAYVSEVFLQFRDNIEDPRLIDDISKYKERIMSGEIIRKKDYARKPRRSLYAVRDFICRLIKK